MNVTAKKLRDANCYSVLFTNSVGFVSDTSTQELEILLEVEAAGFKTALFPVEVTKDAEAVLNRETAVNEALTLLNDEGLLDVPLSDTHVLHATYLNYMHAGKENRALLAKLPFRQAIQLIENEGEDKLSVKELAKKFLIVTENVESELEDLLDQMPAQEIADTFVGYSKADAELAIISADIIQQTTEALESLEAQSGAGEQLGADEQLGAESNEELQPEQNGLSETEGSQDQSSLSMAVTEEAAIDEAIMEVVEDDDDAIMEVVEDDDDAIMEVVEDDDAVMEVIEDDDAVMEVIEDDDDTVMEVIEDDDDEVVEVVED